MASYFPLYKYKINAFLESILNPFVSTKAKFCGKQMDLRIMMPIFAKHEK